MLTNYFKNLRINHELVHIMMDTGCDFETAVMIYLERHVDVNILDVSEHDCFKGDIYE